MANCEIATLTQAKDKVQRLLQERRTVLYDEAWSLALTKPLVWESDLKEWVRDWEVAGFLTVEGKQPKQRVPHRDKRKLLEVARATGKPARRNLRRSSQPADRFGEVCVQITDVPSLFAAINGSCTEYLRSLGMTVNEAAVDQCPYADRIQPYFSQSENTPA